LQGVALRRTQWKRHTRAEMQETYYVGALGAATRLLLAELRQAEAVAVPGKKGSWVWKEKSIPPSSRCGLPPQTVYSAHTAETTETAHS
jgi:hypothetical protein